VVCSKYKLVLSNPRSFLPFNVKVKKKFNSVLGTKLDNKSLDFLVWDPNAVFFPKFFSKKVAFYSGNFFSAFQVRSSMLFSRIGLFARTKRLGSSIHVVKRKKKKK
jgi:ribosomal protein S19